MITGSRGAIGRRLKTALVKSGECVFGYDHGYDPDHVEYGDINDQHLLRDKLCDMKVEGIIHLAAVSRVQLSQSDEQRCFCVNVEGSRNVFNGAYQSQLKPWVIYASTREVYGQQEHFPVKEDASLIPCNVYGQSKLKAEEIAAVYQRAGLSITVMRLSAVYGAIKHYQENKVVTALTRQALLGRDLEINGAHNIFDFIHVDDVIRAIGLAIERCRLQKKGLPPINVCSGIGTSLEQLAQTILGMINSNSRIIRKNADSSFASRFIGCPKLASDLMGWQPLISLEEGIQQFIEMLSSNHHLLKEAV
ncbi:NAD-dependent epimerase/dehydratase family protein [Cysteiniphilum litorale]|uniref:NAD-dependent epimerase/dehydratase family protein n=1 Tax=Cysteiniphilum litorale TaxID=2056700 RepID=UPI000E34547B|nr:NAD(P)-dependent oxidoreductase [Cysteiniphilum litorale]